MEAAAGAATQGSPMAVVHTLPVQVLLDCSMATPQASSSLHKLTVNGTMATIPSFATVKAFYIDFYQ
jgi:hypothetical protein